MGEMTPNPTARLAEPMTAEKLTADLKGWQENFSEGFFQRTVPDDLRQFADAMLDSYIPATLAAIAAARAEVERLTMLRENAENVADRLDEDRTDLRARASSAERERDVLRAAGNEMRKALKDAEDMLIASMHADLPGWKEKARKEFIDNHDGIKGIRAAVAGFDAAPPVACEGCKERMELVQRWRSMAYPHRHDCDCPLCVDTKAMLAALLAASTEAGREG